MLPLLPVLCILGPVCPRAGVGCANTVGQATFTSTFAYSPTQPLLAVGQGYGEIALLTTDGTVVQTIGSGQGDIYSLAFSPDGQTLASGGGVTTNVNGEWIYHESIKLWRVSDGACLQTLTGHTNMVYSVAFAPDGQTLASGSEDHTIKLWRVSDGACLQTLTGHTNMSLLWRSRRMGRRWPPAVGMTPSSSGA